MFPCPIESHINMLGSHNKQVCFPCYSLYCCCYTVHILWLFKNTLVDFYDDLCLAEGQQYANFRFI